ncbi:MAG: 2-oxo acid dehydrogenase subunit E2, partial [Myxococcales bacterium]
MFEFKLADLGEGIHEAEIVKWYVKVGDKVEMDDPLIDVETDKATVTIPCPKTGAIVQRLGEVGDILHVGQLLVVIDDGAGQAAATAPSAPAEAEAKTVETKPATAPSAPAKAEAKTVETKPAAAPTAPAPR